MRVISFWQAAVLVVAVAAGYIMETKAADPPISRVDDALQNVSALVRVNRVGYATVWDGNKYIQCRRLPDRATRCEAAGTSMQPSLRAALTGERLNRLMALGWVLDPAFGNYVQTFPPDTPTARIADQIVRALAEGYDATIEELEINTRWIADIACPPRNGPRQNLAGSVNDAPAMRPTAVFACSYTPATGTPPQTVASLAELVALHGATTTAEIQRLRINATHRVHVVFDVGIGYVQCSPEIPPSAMYCEAQSAESWAPLTTILTPERVARLHSAGYADPGRAPNYWKSYALEKFSDAAIAGEVLSILYDVYGYRGASKLKTLTE